MGSGFESRRAYSLPFFSFHFPSPTRIYLLRHKSRMGGLMYTMTADVDVPTVPTARVGQAPDPGVADRALGALQGLALGDALGMPSQAMSPDWIRRHYGRICGLVDSSREQPYAPAMPAGHITDDTEQALLLVDLLAQGRGIIDPHAFANALLGWEEKMAATGSLDLLGPSTKAALEKVHHGADPAEGLGAGTTNGAAMRVTPVGIAWPASDPGRLADAVRCSTRVTHDSPQGFSSAYLVATAVSLGVEGSLALPPLSPNGARPVDLVGRVLGEALRLTAAVPKSGHWSPVADIVPRAREALALVGRLPGDLHLVPSIEEVASTIRSNVGTSMEANESVPAALALASQFADDPLQALLVAANLGGDTDTIGAICGAILGACLGTAAWPQEMVAQVERVSGIDLRSAADTLVGLRVRPSAPLPGPVVIPGPPPIDEGGAASGAMPAPSLSDAEYGATSAAVPDIRGLPDTPGDRGVLRVQGGSGEGNTAAPSGLPNATPPGSLPSFVGTTTRSVWYLGQVIVDLAMTVEAIPEPGGDVFADDPLMLPGGGFNVLVAARRMGATVRHGGALGEGAFASLARTALERADIHFMGPRMVGVDQGYCVAMTEPNGERTFISTRGAETLVPEESFADLPVTDGDVIVLCGYSLTHPGVAEAVSRGSARWLGRDLGIIIDVSPMVAEIPADRLKMVAGLQPLWSMNEREGRLLLARIGDISPAGTPDGTTLPFTDPNIEPSLMCEMLATFLVAPVVLRVGAAGAWWCAGPKATPLHIPSPSVDVVDTNGAGDTHTGVLAALLTEGVPIERALLMANCAGALSTTARGGASCPARREVEATAALLSTGTLPSAR